MEVILVNLDCLFLDFDMRRRFKVDRGLEGRNRKVDRSVYGRCKKSEVMRKKKASR